MFPWTVRRRKVPHIPKERLRALGRIQWGWKGKEWCSGAEWRLLAMWCWMVSSPFFSLGAHCAPVFSGVTTVSFAKITNPQETMCSCQKGCLGDTCKIFFWEILLRKHRRAILLAVSECLLNKKGQTPSAEPAVECPFAPNSGFAARAQSLPGGCSLPCYKGQAMVLAACVKHCKEFYPIPYMKYWSGEGFWMPLSLNQLLCPRINKIHIEVTAGGQSWLLPASLVSLVAHVLGSMHIYPFITAFSDSYLFIY